MSELYSIIYQFFIAIAAKHYSSLATPFRFRPQVQSKRFYIFKRFYNFQKNSRAPNIKMYLKGNLCWFESLGIEGTKPKWRALSNYKWLSLILILTYFLNLIDIHIYTNIPFILLSLDTTPNLPRSSSLPSCLQLPLPSLECQSSFYAALRTYGMHQDVHHAQVRGSFIT